MNKAARPARRQGWIIPVAVIILSVLLVAVVAPLLAREDQAAAQDPDFDTVDDPLDGDYQLFTVDDLVLARTKPMNSETESEVNNYVLETANETISSQTKRTVATPPCYIVNEDIQPLDVLPRQPQQTRSGRFFNLAYDVIVTLSPSSSASGNDCSGSNNMALHIQDVKTNDNIVSTFTMPAKNTALAMGDFTLDGFEDLFILSDSEVRAASATDINDKSAGMNVGPVTSLDSVPGTGHDPVTGDFNNDGLRDVAWIGGGSVHFATVCPGSVAGTMCDGKQALEVLLNPDSLPVPNMVSITAGNYGSYDGTGLLLITSPPFNSLEPTRYFARWYQFNNDWNAIGGGEISNVLFYETFMDVTDHTLAVSEKLDWLGGSDQAIVASHGEVFGAGGNNDSTVLNVNVITFDSALNTMKGYSTGDIDWHNTGFISPLNPPWLNGLAVGRFAAIGDDPNDTDFNPQIAILRNDLTVHFFSVDPTNEDYTPKSQSMLKLDSSLGINNIPTLGLFSGGNPEPYPFNWLSTGDLQGRSARLGSPTVIRIDSHSQPSVILGAPPMHVDYILPDQATATEWQVVNFSAVPDTFNSNYTMSETTTNQSADTNRTSYTYATTEEGGGKFKIKVPVIGSIGGALQKTTENKHEDVSETYAFKENEFKYDASTTTGFGDEIWYDESSFNLFMYPVIGQTICPADNSDCDPSEEQPLYVMFSGPNSGGTGPGPGANTEWYQPVHEPGNIFSYPWNETQLAQRVSGGLNLLTGPQHFFTDNSSQVQSLSWSNSQDKEQTVGTTNSHSYETSYSLSGGKQIGEAVDVNLSGDLDYNNSNSVETLNKSSSSVGASQGISIAKPGTFLDTGLYQYRVEPYIFGRNKPDGTVDDVNLPQNIQATGPLQAAFAANPKASGTGSWWGADNSPYSQNVDIALNHPMRWALDDPTGTQDSLDCLFAEARNNCMIFNDPVPDDLWNSEFYWMRGLLVTVGGVSGPQRSQAAEGDDVVLQARVYNYSFKDMDANSTIHVRFYRQQIQGTTPVGDSVLISEETTGPLPGFANNGGTANWKTVTTTLDTDGLGDTYHIFWVLVWAEDGSGNMISELQGHGLESKPGSLANIGAVPLEMVTLDDEQKTFSNNVGYLHSKFYIADSPPQTQPPGDLVLEIKNALVTPQETMPGGRVIVSADITAEGAPAEAVHVRLYPDAAAWRAHQDDPTLPKPRAFDVEMLPFIDAGESDRLEVPYSTNACGTQEILIVARSGVQSEPTTATATFSNGPCLAYFPVLPIQAP